MLKIIRKFHDKVILMGISQMSDMSMIKLTTDKGDIILQVEPSDPSYEIIVRDNFESGKLVKVSEPKTAKDYESLALSRMTGEEIEENMTDKELKEYERLLGR